MKSKEELISMLMSKLDELQYGVDDLGLEKRLRIELTLLDDILGDDVPEDQWDNIELFRADF